MIPNRIEDVYKLKKTLQEELNKPSNSNYICAESVTLTYRNIDKIDEASSSTPIKPEHAFIPYIHLSHNNLENLLGIDQFLNLQGLSVSHNKLNTWQELQRIPNPDNIAFLRVRRNPLCNDPSYHANILRLFPNLQQLDDLRVDEKCLQLKYQTQHSSQHYIIQFLKVLQIEFEKINTKMSQLYPNHIQRSSTSSQQQQQDQTKNASTNTEINFDFFDALMAFINHDPTLKLKKSASSILIGGFLLRLWKIVGSYMIDSKYLSNQQPPAIEELQLDFFHRILVKYRNRNDHSLERFLEQQCQANPKIDHNRLFADLEYGYSCFLHEFYATSDPPVETEALFLKQYLGVQVIQTMATSSSKENTQYNPNHISKTVPTVMSQKGLNKLPIHPRTSASSQNLNRHQQSISSRNIEANLAETQEKEELRAIRQYFPLYLLNQDFMEAVLEIVVEKMLNLLQAYELLVYGNLEAIEDIVSGFRIVQNTFSLYNPSSEIYRAIENISNESRINDSRRIADSRTKSQRSIDKLKRNLSGVSQAASHRSGIQLNTSNNQSYRNNNNNINNNNNTIQQNNNNNNSRSRLSLRQQHENSGIIESNRNNSMDRSANISATNRSMNAGGTNNNNNRSRSRSRSHSASMIDQLNDTLNRLNVKRSTIQVNRSKLTHRSNSGLIPQSYATFQQQGIHGSHSAALIGENPLTARAGPNSVQLESGRMDMGRRYSRMYEQSEGAAAGAAGVLDNYNSQFQDQEDQGIKDHSILTQQQQQQQQRKNQGFSTAPIYEESEQNSRINNRVNQSSLANNGGLSSRSPNQLLTTNDKETQSSYRYNLQNAAASWDAAGISKRSKQKAQFFVSTLKMVLQPRLNEIMSQFMKKLVFASDKRCLILFEIMSKRMQKNALKNWQRQTLSKKKNSVYEQIQIHKCFVGWRKVIAQKRIDAVRHNALRLYYKVFFALVKIMRNKRKIKKALRRIVRFTIKKSLRPTFQKLALFYHITPKNTAANEIAIDKLQSKGRKIIEEASMYFKLQGDSKIYKTIQDQSQKSAEGLASNIRNQARISDSFRIASNKIDTLNAQNRLQVTSEAQNRMTNNNPNASRRSLIPDPNSNPDFRNTTRPQQSQNPQNQSSTSTIPRR